MAEDLAPAGSPLAPAKAEPGPDAASPAAADTTSPSRPFRYRFGIAYLILAVIAGAGVGAAVLLVEREPEEEVAWSSWKPVGRETSYPAQIAERIGERYRSTSGRQLVTVIPSPPQVQTREGAVPIQWVAIQDDTGATTQSDDSDNFDVVSVSDSSLMYALCGLGDRCSIREGEPTQARGRLLRRESLELALYSFKYVDDLNSVIVLMPPNLGDPTDDADDTQTALFFQRGDFERELDRPIQTTLARNAVQGMQIRDGLTVDRLTQRHWFLYDFQPTQAGGWVIVLAPLFNLP